jgi:hypothetical protein
LNIHLLDEHVINRELLNSREANLSTFNVVKEVAELPEDGRIGRLIKTVMSARPTLHVVVAVPRPIQ